MMAVQVDVDGGFTFEPPRKLFDGQMYMNIPDRERGVQMYDVHPDGDRFLMVTQPQEQVSQEQIHIVLNWFEELKELVPLP